MSKGSHLLTSSLLGVLVVSIILQSPKKTEIEWHSLQGWKQEAAETGKPVWILFTSPNSCPGCRALEPLLSDERIIEVSEKFVCVKYEVEDMRDGPARIWPSSSFYTKTGHATMSMGVSVFEIPTTNVESLISHLNGGFEMATKER